MAASSRKITSFFPPKLREDHDDSSEEDSDSAAPPRKQSKHRSSFDPLWKKHFPWIIYMPEDDDGNGPSMYCELCRKHNKTIRTTWVNALCRMFRKDKLREHQASQRHADSLVAESHALAANEKWWYPCSCRATGCPEAASSNWSIKVFVLAG